MRKPRPVREIATGRPLDPVFPPTLVEHRRRILPDPHAEEADRVGREGRLQRARMLCSVLVSREQAAAKAERLAAQRAQLRRVGASETWASDADRGAQGPAMRARGVKVEDVLVDTREGDDGLTKLERVTVARVRDGVIDHYERAGVLWGRRLEAMEKLAGLYQSSRVSPGVQRGGDGLDRGHDEIKDRRSTAWGKFCQASDHLSASVRNVVEDVARGLFPSALDAVPKLRLGAMQLADHFQLCPDKHP
ncbi:hypothetical protein VQH23_16190 [Pararoseomonas sp. SCSIO 73927]|uniref:hypothetical protein n=1 Tax=Pararoseomonas sp. SCSIO 73927 TaxID=3114537 RepID=UPI0030D1B256